MMAGRALRQTVGPDRMHVAACVRGNHTSAGTELLLVGPSGADLIYCAQWFRAAERKGYKHPHGQKDSSSSHLRLSFYYECFARIRGGLLTSSVNKTCTHRFRLHHPNLFPQNILQTSPISSYYLSTRQSAVLVSLHSMGGIQGGFISVFVARGLTRFRFPAIPWGEYKGGSFSQHRQSPKRVILRAARYIR
jgi:hypothetical protein